MTQKIKKGINAQVVKKISSMKHEPAWMLKQRLEAYDYFLKSKNPQWGPDLKFINFQDYYYYFNPNIASSTTWENIPDKVKATFKKLNIPEFEAKTLSGVNNQFDSESIYHETVNMYAKMGVIFCSMDEALKKHATLLKKYFGKLVPNSDNKYASLNSAVWSGGSFIYVPKNITIEKPLQSYFRINTKSVGQFERTLIVVEENSQIHYMEGCTAPIYDKNNLHAAVVEIFVGKNAKVRYSTIQNWSDNVLNLVTKRAIVDTNGYMEWIDGNIGSKFNMKYPTTILKGDGSRGKCISIATAKSGVIQDSGAKMIHIGANTNSYILSKSIAGGGGRANYRGNVSISKSAINSYSEVSCDSIILDSKSSSDTYPTEFINNNSSFIKHEAKITNLDKEKMYYINSRGIDANQAQHLLIMGFIAPFTDALPLEYAVELNHLLHKYF